MDWSEILQQIHDDTLDVLLSGAIEDAEVQEKLRNIAKTTFRLALQVTPKKRIGSRLLAQILTVMSDLATVVSGFS